MVTVLEGYNTEEHRSVVRFFVGKRTRCKDTDKEMVPVSDGKCLSRKAVHNWIEKCSQGRSKVADDEMEVGKWLRQQSKDFCAAGFDALVKRWDKCIRFLDLIFLIMFGEEYKL
jgi:hypothetical protein